VLPQPEAYVLLVRLPVTFRTTTRVINLLMKPDISLDIIYKQELLNQIDLTVFLIFFSGFGSLAKRSDNRWAKAVNSGKSMLSTIEYLVMTLCS
jgi:hypothetical protein